MAIDETGAARPAAEEEGVEPKVIHVDMGWRPLALVAGWRFGQWVVALLALLVPLGLMAGVVYVFWDRVVGFTD